MANEGFDPDGFDNDGFQTGDATPETQAETPVITPSGGLFFAPQLVSMSAGTVGSTIYYTINGDTPTDLSTEYTTPFELSVDTTVKAIAYADGFDPSDVAVAVFDFEVAGAVTSGWYIIFRRRKR